MDATRRVRERVAAFRRQAIPPPLPRKKPPLLDLAEVDRFKNFLVFAQSEVEGYFSGKHKSPYYGSNVEFADYKEYVAGEDVGNIDWRVYGRTHKLFLRKYQEETDMVCYLLLDRSASMKYAGAGLEPKFLTAAKIAATLAYLMIHQGDKAALTMFAEQITTAIPPGGTRRHLYHLLNALEDVQPAAGTAIAGALQQCAAAYKKRGRIVLISDFFGDLDPLFDALGQFVHRKFEILLLQVLAPDEIDLPSLDIARFIDMETNEHIEVEPEVIRTSYRETMERLIAEIAARSTARRMQHALIQTSNPYLQAIEAYLGFRGRAPGW